MRHVTDAIIVEGAERGQLIAICAEPSCEVHHAETKNAHEAQTKMRGEQKREDAKRRIESATRFRILAAVLDKVTAPLKKADMELIALTLADRLPTEYVRALLQRHKLGEMPNPSKAIAAHMRSIDESAVARFMVEASLIECAANPYSNRGPALLDAAKRYRVNAGEIAQKVKAQHAAKAKAG